MKKLNTTKDHIRALLKYWREYYTDGGFPTKYDLKMEMIDNGICPRCGANQRSWSSIRGHFPCSECDFNITPNEIDSMVNEDGRLEKRGILDKRLKQKSKRKVK